MDYIITEQVEMENQLTCPMCQKQYTNDNLPKLLTSCGHTYCGKCIKSMISRCSPEGGIRFTVTCPEDSSKMNLISSDMASFPTNIALLKVITAKLQASSHSVSFKDESFDVSKIAKKDELPEDDETNELGNELVAAINQGIGIRQDKGSFFSGGESETSEKSKKSSQSRLKISGETATGIEQFSTPSETKVQMCLLHNKPLEIVCTKDLVKICSKCAIFGEHKGHDFKSIQQIQSKNQDLYKEIIGIFQEKALIVERFANQSIQQDLIEILKNTAKKHKKEIGDKYKKFIEEVHKAEKEAITKLDSVISSVQGKIKSLLKVDESLLVKYHKWEQKSFQQIELSEGTSFQGKIEFFFKGQTTLQNGINIIKSMKDEQQKLLVSVQQLIANIGLIINDKQIEQIRSFMEVHQNVKKQKEMQKQKERQKEMQKQKQYKQKQQRQKQSVRKTHELIVQKQNKPMNTKSVRDESSIIDHEESLLQIQFQDQISYIEIGTSRVKEEKMKIESTEDHPKIKTQASSVVDANAEKFKPNTKKTSIALPSNTFLFKELDQSQCKDLNQSMISLKQNKKEPLSLAAMKKKVKMLKIPQKYEKVLQQILQDQSDTIDLTNAELGDGTITQICQLIKQSSKAKTVKLIRNKLTDDVLPKILPYLTGVLTLNLSQNNFSQNALSFFIDHRNQLPNLKSIIFSQNKIVERKHKTLIDKLRKLDLIVSV